VAALLNSLYHIVRQAL